MAQMKWIQEARERMERKGTVGSLRRIAKREGLIKGSEKLSSSDLSKLARKAEKTGNTALARKVNFAKNVRGR